MNPGNMRPDSRFNWQGQIGEHGGFLVFSSLQYGVRAMAVDIAGLIKRGVDTPRKIIMKWCVGDVSVYIKTVSDDSGIGMDEVINPDTESLFDLLKAMITFEQGHADMSIITDHIIKEGISMAAQARPTLIQLVHNTIDAVANATGQSETFSTIIVCVTGALLVISGIWLKLRS
jgi:hypothetical protein